SLQNELQLLRAEFEQKLAQRVSELARQRKHFEQVVTELKASLDDSDVRFFYLHSLYRACAIESVSATPAQHQRRNCKAERSNSVLRVSVGEKIERISMPEGPAGDSNSRSPAS